jgi:hypothetical protein
MTDQPGPLTDSAIRQIVVLHPAVIRRQRQGAVHLAINGCQNTL